ncbi:hypothetical protein ACFO4E_08325 [Nocardiopsis mangrovi]|uniref:Uncharacterized protein n=1 Tax=Nocardiopsis mangrovi TaxID=1179818 RepID=A0ABV9DT17_9ACTN
MLNGAGRTAVAPWARSGAAWRDHAPAAAALWSLGYAALGAYWALTGDGFPFAEGRVHPTVGALLGRAGPEAAWAVVVLAGIPAALLGAAMARGVRAGRPLIIGAAAALAGVLLLAMADVGLLILLGYTPYAIVGLLTGADVGGIWLDSFDGAIANQVFCLVGGFIWLGAAVTYARRSGDACLRCGRGEGVPGWAAPAAAARWGRVAVAVAVAVPVLYAATRYAWALGIPLGISERFLREGRETGAWTSGLFLATFGLVGAVLTLGLVQRWGEVFPRWMIGLAGRRVPIALAVVPASLVSVLILLGGIAMVSGHAQLVASGADGTADITLLGTLPTTLFPAWGAALALAALAYRLRRRGTCAECGRGAGQAADPAAPEDPQAAAGT